MNADEIILTNLYISLQIAQAKKKLYEDKNCDAPDTLVARIEEIKEAIKELET